MGVLPPVGALPLPFGLAACCCVAVLVADGDVNCTGPLGEALGVPGNKGGVPMLCWIGVPNESGVPAGLAALTPALAAVAGA